MRDKKQGTKPGDERAPVAAKFTRGLRGRVLTKNAGIFKIIGIGESTEPGGWSWRKHELLSDCGQKSYIPE